MIRNSLLLVSSRIKFERICLLPGRSINRFLNLKGKQAAIEEMDELKANPFYSKYAAKLEEIKRSKPEEFQQKIDELSKTKKSSNTCGGNTDDKVDVQNKLGAVMNVDLLDDKTQDEIIKLWKDYHEDKSCIYTAIQTNEYNAIKDKVSQFPNFIYPIPRHGGYEFFVQKWVGDLCHFTPLVTYQQHKENAPACLTIHHYIELADSKNLVLMRGFPDRNVLSVHESQLLALQIKMYYGLNSGLKFNLVRMFNNCPESFKHMDLVAEFENYKKDIILKKELVGTSVDMDV